MPAFDFDGEEHTVISADEHSLSVAYDGWLCRYTTDGTVTVLDQPAVNRNGYYRTYLASAQNVLTVKIEIAKITRQISGRIKHKMPKEAEK